jgi:hypothetical protein
MCEKQTEYCDGIFLKANFPAESVTVCKKGWSILTKTPGIACNETESATRPVML